MFTHASDCKEEILPNGVKRVIKGYIKDLMLVELTWQKGMVGVIHHHPHRQAGYVVKGSFEVEDGPEKTTIYPGDVYYTEADIPHGAMALEDNSVLLDIFTPMREDFVK